MAKALGVGGVFFKCEDPKKLTTWYEKWLGIPVDPAGYVSFQSATVPPGGYTVWGPFENATNYFDPSERDCMINLMVDDLEGALAQVKEGGAEIVGEIEEYEFGRFGWFMDPEGTKVELWVPVEVSSEQ